MSPHWRNPPRSDVARSHLKPGTGYLEQIELDLQPRCDDGTLKGSIMDWYDYLVDATRRASRPIEYQHNTRQLLERAGFTDIQEQVIRAPYNPWPKDSQLKEIGRWYCVGFTEGLEALSLGPLTRVYGWPADNVRRLIDDVKSCVTAKQHHGYNNMWVPCRSCSRPCTQKESLTYYAVTSGPQGGRKNELSSRVQLFVSGNHSLTPDKKTVQAARSRCAPRVLIGQRILLQRPLDQKIGPARRQRPHALRQHKAAGTERTASSANIATRLVRCNPKLAVNNAVSGAATRHHLRRRRAEQASPSRLCHAHSDQQGYGNTN